MELETQRLILRRFTLDDIDGFFRLCSEPALIRYVGNKPVPSLEEARKLMISAVFRDYEVYGFGRLACIEKETGTLIGFNGLKHMPEMGETDVGYRFFPEHWSKGYATESSIAVMKHGHETLRIERIVGIVHPENVASAAVIKKLGLVYEKKTRFEPDGEDFDLYA